MSSRAIEVAIQKLAGVHKTDDLVCMVCTVQSVDENAATCDCMGENDIIIPNVKLQAGVCDGLLILPVVGSTVIIAMSKYNEPFVFMISDVDKFYLSIAGQNDAASLTITNDGKIKLNDGTYNGLVKVDDLVTKMNDIQHDLNNLKKVFSTGWTVLAQDGGAALKTAATTWALQTFSDLQADDLQSKKITHGQ